MRCTHCQWKLHSASHDGLCDDCRKAKQLRNEARRNAIAALREAWHGGTELPRELEVACLEMISKEQYFERLREPAPQPGGPLE